MRKLLIATTLIAFGLAAAPAASAHAASLGDATAAAAVAPRRFIANVSGHTLYVREYTPAGTTSALFTCQHALDHLLITGFESSYQDNWVAPAKCTSPGHLARRFAITESFRLSAPDSLYVREWTPEGTSSTRFRCANPAEAGYRWVATSACKAS